MKIFFILNGGWGSTGEREERKMRKKWSKKKRIGVREEVGECVRERKRDGKND